MRVLHLTRDYPPPGRGGISTAVAGLVAATARHGIDAAILSLERGRRGGAPLERTIAGAHPVVRVRDPARLHDARAALPPGDFDVVHVHEPLWLPVVAVVAERAGLVVTPHVDHAHLAALRGTGTANLSVEAQRQLLLMADIVAAPSAAAAAHLGAGQPDIAARLVVIPHGIEPPPRAECGMAFPREPLLAYIGRFDASKGTADFAAAIVPVLEKHPEARVLIAGGLPANPRSERRWIRRWNDSWPARIAVRIEIAGWLAPEELAGVYRRAAVVVVPSHYETFGLVALEAMAHGAAVVATRAGGLAEIVRDGITGLLCDPGDREALAAAMSRALADPQFRSRLGAAGAATAARDHDWEQLVPRWIATWERAIAARRQTRGRSATS